MVDSWKTRLKAFFGKALLEFIFKNKRHVAWLVAILGCSCLAALLEGASFSFVLLAFDSLSAQATSLRVPLFGIEKWFTFGERAFVWYLIIAVVLQVIRSAFAYMGQTITTFLGAEAQQEFQKKIYARILQFSFRFASSYKAGDLVEHMKMPITTTLPLLDAWNRLIIASLVSTALFCLIATMSFKLTAIVLSVFLVLGLLQKYVFWHLSELSYRVAGHLMDINEEVVQSVQGLRTIITNGKKDYSFSRVVDHLQKAKEIGVAINTWNNRITPVNEITGIVLVAACLFCGSIWGDIPSSTLFAFLMISYRLATRIQLLMSAVATIYYHSGGIRRIDALLDPAGKEFCKAGGESFPGFMKGLEVRDVSLKYPANDQMTLRNLSFSVNRGEVIGIVGASGAGKSSLIDTIIRLYEPTGGQIFVDGTDYSVYSLQSWVDRLGVVSQDIFLFNETIEESIRFGNRQVSFEEVEEAARCAGAHEFISALPEKYQTLLGPKGRGLSGGEKQRISLARALLKKPDLLILDEATSSLDSQSEQLIQETLQKLRSRLTIMAIAHRLSTVQDADQILVMDRGMIIERGNHDHLLAMGGKYAKLWKLQTEKEVFA